MKTTGFFILVFAIGVCRAQPVAPAQLLGRLPLRFERDRDPHTGDRYTARGSNFRLDVASTENWIAWQDASGETVRVHTSLIQARRNARIEAEEILSGLTNYFVGTAQHWRTDVTAFGRIRIRDVYPGIDLVFHGSDGRLEYDFVVSPHADANAIRLAVDGHRDLRVGVDGDLSVLTSAGEIRWKQPEVYQEFAGKRSPVEGRFVLAGAGTVQFQVGDYDRNRTLVIDPVLSYATYLGGAKADAVRGIAVDGSGNVYIAGVSDSVNLPTASAFQPNFGGQTANIFPAGDGFVAKFSPTGSLLYLTYIGGSQDDGVSAIAVDSAGDVYITGATTSVDFPTKNPYQKSMAGIGGLGSFLRTGDAFVAKINPTGNELLYSTYLGGSQDDIGFGIAIDSSGDAYVAGATLSSNFPVTQGVVRPQFSGAGGEPIKPCCNAPIWDPGDAFVAKLDPTGSQLLFSTFLGGSLDDVAYAVALDSSNNVYVSGCTLSQDFPTTTGALQRIYMGVDSQNLWQNFGDGFVTKLNSTATSLVYSTYFGGTGDDCVSSIAVDTSGDVYMTGSTSTQNLQTSQTAFQPTYAGYYALPYELTEQLIGDAFVAKLNPAGSALLYLSYLGGQANDAGTGIAIDNVGDAYVTGYTDSSNFPTAGTPLQPVYGGDRGFGWLRNYQPMGDAFLAVINPTGSQLLYSSFYGGSADDAAGGVALDNNGNVYMAGGTDSKNLTTTSNAVQTTYGGGLADGFYVKYSGFPLGQPAITSVVNPFGNSATIAPNTWVAVRGTGLAPSGDSRVWTAADFVNNQMPTSLDGVSVTMNGIHAFVYYISGTQINVLTPPNLSPGPVQVVVSVGGITSAAFTSQAASYSTSLFVFNNGHYVVATHFGTYTDVGPTSLYPGLTTPANPGEEIVLYANGFSDVAVVSGSETQYGALPLLPTIQVGGINATVLSAYLVSPGLYQFNFYIPDNVNAGDNSISVQYKEQVTQPGTLITIQ